MLEQKKRDLPHSNRKIYPLGSVLQSNRIVQSLNRLVSQKCWKSKNVSNNDSRSVWNLRNDLVVVGANAAFRRLFPFHFYFQVGGEIQRPFSSHSPFSVTNFTPLPGTRCQPTAQQLGPSWWAPRCVSTSPPLIVSRTGCVSNGY